MCALMGERQGFINQHIAGTLAENKKGTQKNCSVWVRNDQN